MKAEEDLQKLLKSINPVLNKKIFVFCSVTKEELKKIEVSPVCQFYEKEEAQRNGLEFIYPCKMITLNVNSSLNAIGFIAAVAGKLAEYKISVNPISAYYHDHLFVPADKAEQVMEILLKNFSNKNVV